MTPVHTVLTKYDGSYVRHLVIEEYPLPKSTQQVFDFAEEPTPSEFRFIVYHSCDILTQSIAATGKLESTRAAAEEKGRIAFEEAVKLHAWQLHTARMGMLDV